VTGSCSNYGI